MPGLSLVVASGSYCLVVVLSFSLLWFLLLRNVGSRCAGFSSCCSQAQLPHSMWNLPEPGIEPVSPPLAGGFLTTVPPGKSKTHIYYGSPGTAYFSITIRVSGGCNPVVFWDCSLIWGAAGERTISKFPQVIGKVNFLAAVNLRALVSCWKLPLSSMVSLQFLAVWHLHYAHLLKCDGRLLPSQWKGVLCSLASKMESYIYVKHKHKNDRPITFLVLGCLLASHMSYPHSRGGNWLYTRMTEIPGDGFIGMTLKSVCCSIWQCIVVILHFNHLFWRVYMYKRNIFFLFLSLNFS